MAVNAAVIYEVDKLRWLYAERLLIHIVDATGIIQTGAGQQVRNQAKKGDKTRLVGFVYTRCIHEDRSYA